MDESEVIDFKQDLDYYEDDYNDILYDEDDIEHYGIKRRSGRWPWGSGDNPYQHESWTFMQRVDGMKADGMTEAEIAETIGCSVRELRAKISNAKTQIKNDQVARVKSLMADGITNRSEIARIMGVNEGTIRSWMKEESVARRNQAQQTADFIKEQINKKGMIDIGTGVEHELGISRTKLDQAIQILQEEGYPVYKGGLPQITNKGKQTNLKVICPIGTEHKDIYKFEQVYSLSDYVSQDNGQTYIPKFVQPASMDSKRLEIKYAEEGGIDKDGLIEIRRGVDDLSLGNVHYAQVRILVDNDRYIKGMAVYSDDLPDGVDVRFNTNKPLGTPMRDVLKKTKENDMNPFGSLIKEGVLDPDDPSIKSGGQSYYYDKNGVKRLSLINKREEEGGWDDWSRTLPSQFLAKQPQSLMKKQIQISKDNKKDELDEILALDNPTIKKALLNKYALSCDSDAEHLQAAALPRQSYKVIMPMPSLRDNEVYAPTYNDGETVALIRFPHAGTYEIPILTVNNKNKEGRKTITNDAIDAIGINKHVADRMSGADFDGDTVMVIPTGGSINVKSTPVLKGLVGFDPSMEYPYKSGIKLMSETYKQKEMGVASNLIMDMTLKGANDEEVARAVKYSMVVIDAVKHKLDYQRAYQECGIANLKKKYQGVVEEDGRYHEGAATLLTRAKREKDVIKRQGSPSIDAEGNLVWKNTDQPIFVNKEGKTITKTQKSTEMAEVKDAMELVSKQRAPAELIYAEYANSLKDLARTARKEMMLIEENKTNREAKAQYAREIESLNSKLKVSQLNAPRERQAQRIATDVVNCKKMSNPDMSKAELKKMQQIALTEARAQVGAKRTPIDITEKEWEAIQSGGVSPNKLSQMIKFIDDDRLKQLATPRESKGLSQTRINRIYSMSKMGYTPSEIANQMGISTQQVVGYLRSKEGGA